MGSPRIVLFAADEVGHFQRMLPLMAGLRRRGARVEVFTYPRFRTAVESTGAAFTDLSDLCSEEAADATSQPAACRSVAFAGCYADVVAERLACDRPALILHDTFAVIGYVVGRVLGVPCVNICAGHNVDPETFQAALAVDPRVFVSQDCHAAVERLRSRFGITNASPFLYVATLSLWLNICCEPPEYLAPHERQVFAPLAFFGSLADTTLPSRREPGTEAHFGAEPETLKVYVSFGTVAWRYYRPQVVAALSVIAAELSGRPGTTSIVSLGGHALSVRDLAALELPGVRVVRYANQREVLAEADVFITHHGLNSTHEAVYHRVPMISYPLFWDQPALAARCQEFGIAVPLVATPRGPVTRSDVARALDAVVDADFLQPALKLARERELAVMRARDGVLDQLMDLAGGRSLTLGR